MPADVNIEFGPLPRPVSACLKAKPHFSLYADDTAILRSPHGLRMMFDKGRTLRLEVPDGMNTRLLHAWLMGPGLGLICHQRDTPPLHASAVAVAGRSIAIAGDSGAGKSTTARALLNHGCRLLAEDQVIVDPSSRQLHPGVPDLRLSADAAHWFGDRMEQQARVGADEDKFVVASLRDRFDPQPRSLATLFVLSPDPVDAPAAERLSPAAAAALIHRYVYRVRLASFMGKGSGIFRWATALAASVPVFVLRRPDNLSRLGELVTTIEQLVEPRR